ncbi:hypothetical protein L4D06_01175 [Enterovibrio makurazakiensis]|uniref:hypothetical protein n=1 Tax=Enterovibrio makurazakiensis TaxID=2910232 RepID=UPI003D1E81C2
MKKKLFLHIGGHKTGSTSIQRALFAAKDILDKNNFSYFCESIFGDIRPIPYSWVQLSRNEKERTFNAEVKDKESLFRKLSELNDNVIFSCEHLSWQVSEKEKMEIYSQAKGFFDDICVVVYIRRQDQLAISHHQQGSKHLINSSETFYYGNSEKALPRHGDGVFDYLDFNEKISMWADIFGDENIIIRILDRDKLIEGDVVKDFLYSIGLDSSEISAKKVNESNGFERTKVGHLINQVFKHENTVTKLIRKGTDNHGKMLPSKQEAMKFYEKYKLSNESLNERFKINKVGDIFSNDFSMYPDKEMDVWDDGMANKAIINILESIKPLAKFETRSITYNDLFKKAVSLENINIHTAYEIMKLAQQANPEGVGIKSKLDQYENIINKNKIITPV